MVLEWTLSKRLGSKIDLRSSAAASVYITKEAWKHGRLQHQSTGYLRTRGHVHYRPFSVTSEESLRDSEPPLNGYPSTKGQETS